MCIMWWISNVEYSLYNMALLQKRLKILRSLRIEATPYVHHVLSIQYWISSILSGSSAKETYNFKEKYCGIQYQYVWHTNRICSQDSRFAWSIQCDFSWICVIKVAHTHTTSPRGEYTRAYSIFLVCVFNADCTSIKKNWRSDFSKESVSCATSCLEITICDTQ